MKRFNVLRNILRNTKSSNTPLISLNICDKTGIATLNLQKPPVNSLNLEVLREFSAVLADLENDKVKGLILTSKNDGVFTGGLDIMEIYKTDPDRMKKFWGMVRETWMKLYSTPYPTLALINGHAPAGGCLFAVACEYRVMLRNYWIGANETLLGLVAPLWFMDRVRDIIGHRQAEIAFTMGRLFKVEEALHVGLVDEIVETKEQGLLTAEDIIKKYDKASLFARSVTKERVRAETLKNMIANEESDMNHFVNFNSRSDVQEKLGEYVESMRKKL